LIEGESLVIRRALNIRSRKRSTKNDSNDKEKPPLEDASDDNIEYLIEGESLVIRRALNIRSRKMIWINKKEYFSHKMSYHQ
jgi:hypothetical protein